MNEKKRFGIEDSGLTSSLASLEKKTKRVRNLALSVDQTNDNLQSAALIAGV